MKKEGGREGRHKVAVAARRLLSLSKEVDALGGVPGAEKVSFRSRARKSASLRCSIRETDALVGTGVDTSLKSDEGKYRAVLREIRKRHVEVVRQILPER